jgi:hypothetical protein
MVVDNLKHWCPRRQGRSLVASRLLPVDSGLSFFVTRRNARVNVANDKTFQEMNLLRN